MNSRPGHHCRNRLFEWAMAFTIGGMGLWTIVWPRAFADGRFAAIDNLVAVPSLTVILIVVGAARIGALWCNGHCPFYGPAIRSIGSVLGALLFSQMALALWLNHVATGLAASPGIVGYAMLTVAELYSAYRAAGDARRTG